MTVLDWLSRLIPAGTVLLVCACEPLSPLADDSDADSPVKRDGGASADGSMPDGESCGGLLGKGCAVGSFCDYPKAAQCGAADQTGVCKPEPEVCPGIYAPVCGCDDRTYGNACDANSKGISVAHSGVCSSSSSDAGSRDAGGGASDAGGSKTCGGFAGLACKKGEFCDYGAVCSSIADGTGTCLAQPQACDAVYAPVCGCDGKTYGNDCEAHAKGVSIRAKGECTAPQSDAGSGKTCGGIAALSCGKGEYCNYEAPAGQGCSGTIADAAGVCQAKPQACPDIYDPVCGCDGNTYPSACSAHSAGTSVAGKGECKPARVSCDERKAACDRLAPTCPAGQVASVVGACYGPCVNVEQCACSEAAACPHPDMYTCHMSRGVCGPYVN